MKLCVRRILVVRLRADNDMSACLYVCAYSSVLI